MGTDIKPTKNLPGSKPARGRPATGRDSNAAYTASSRINLVEGGGKRLEGKGFESGCYVEPTIMKMRADMPILQHETFAPLLYLVEVKDLQEAIRVQNDVPQGLSSSIFTQDISLTTVCLPNVPRQTMVHRSVPSAAATWRMRYRYPSPAVSLCSPITSTRLRTRAVGSTTPTAPIFGPLPFRDLNALGVMGFGGEPGRL